MPRRLHHSWIFGALIVLALGWTADGYASSMDSGAGVRHAAWEPPARPVAEVPAAATPQDSAGRPAASAAHPAGSPSRTAPAPSASLPASPVTRTTGGASVALTFDDGPGAQTQAILALLRRYHIHATFCLIGVHVRAHPDLVRAIAADGHTLCNHSWMHDEQLGHKPVDVIRSDLQRTNQAIRAAVPGAKITYYRQPGGNWTPAVTAVAQALGMRSLGWNVDPQDWNTVAFPPGPIMVSHVVAAVETHVRPGSIVLSHDAGGDRTSTLLAYQLLVPYLVDQRHFALVPMPVDPRRAPAQPGGHRSGGNLPGGTDPPPKPQPDGPGGTPPSGPPPAPPTGVPSGSDTSAAQG